MNQNPFPTVSILHLFTSFSLCFFKKKNSISFDRSARVDVNLFLRITERTIQGQPSLIMCRKKKKCWQPTKKRKCSVNKEQRNQLIQRKSAFQSCTPFNEYQSVTIDKADYRSESLKPGEKKSRRMRKCHWKQKLNGTWGNLAKKLKHLWASISLSLYH